MIRWDYVISRTAFFALFLGFSTLAINPLLRWGIVRTGESIAGARIDVKNVVSAWGDGYVTMEGVRAADPSDSRRNLFEVEYVRFDIDTHALKRRQIVITDGQARGFEFGTPRNATATLPTSTVTDYGRTLVEQFAVTEKAWLRQAADLTTAGLPEDLKSVVLSHQLAARWSQEQEQIDSRSTYVRERIAQIQELIDGSGQNPLRNLEPYQQAIEELESLQKEGFEISGDMNRVRQQLLMDKSEIDAVRGQDESYLAQQRQIGSLSGERLSTYLLGPEVNELVGKVLGWVRLGRKQIPSDIGIPLAHRNRGEFICFPGVEATPTTVIRHLDFVGSGVFGGAAVEIEGVVRGLTSHPKLATDPVQLELRTVGGPQMTIQASLDVDGEVSHDQIFIQCPSLPSGQQTFGQVDQLAVHVSPGTANIFIRMELVDDAIDGEVRIRQEGVSLVPQLDPRFIGDQISGLVANSLSGVDQMETRAQLTGTIDQPSVEIESSLGPALAAGIARQVLYAVRQTQQQALLAKHREIDDMIAALDQQCEQKSHELTTQFEQRRSQIERIKEIIATRVELNDGVTDEKSPLRETFRR